jgi:hypothetical protein
MRIYFSRHSTSILLHRYVYRPQLTLPTPIICCFVDFSKFKDLFANEKHYFRRTDLFKETDSGEPYRPMIKLGRPSGLQNTIFATS